MDILTLLKANIRYRKGSFISVLILTFIISICLTTIISINSNITKRADESLAENHIGDLVTIISDTKCTDAMLQKVKDNQEIDHIKIIKSVTQELEINRQKQGSPTFFMPYDLDKQSYKVYSKDGLSFQREPEQLKQGEIYVPISIMKLYNCKIGDKAYLTTGNTQKTFTVKGFFEEPFIGTEFAGIKLAFMNQKDFNSLYSKRMLSKEERDKNTDGILGYYLIHIYKTKDGTHTISELKRAINSSSHIIDFSMIAISKEESKSYTLTFTQVISGIMLVFLILLFLVVLIVIGHSISTGIEGDYTNLGVLKAVGYDKGMLRSVFILEYLLAEVIGSVLGVIGSFPAIYYLKGIFIRITGLLSSSKPALGVCSLILAVILLISVLFVFIKTKAIVNVSPICAISGGRDSVYFHSRMELPVEGNGMFLRMAFRQITSNLKQYISSAVIVAILAYFLVTITLLSTGMNEEAIENSFGEVHYDVDVGFYPKEEKSREEVAKLQKQVEKDISGISDIKKTFRLGSNYFSVNGDEYHVGIYNDPSLIKSILKGRAPLYDNEIVVTEIVAKELSVKLGDTVTVEYENKKDDYMISGYYQCTSDMGKTIAISSEGAKKIISDYHQDYVEYVLANPDKSTEIVQQLNKKYGDKIEAKDPNSGNDFGDTITGSMSIMNVFIYTISILFAFVVIIIVCGKIFLKERTDYGIYKALGFTSNVLRLQFALRFALVAFIGSLLGIGLNACLNNAMMSALLYNIGITSFTADYNLASILLPILVLTACFFVFAYLTSRKIKKVDTKNLISSN